MIWIGLASELEPPKLHQFVFFVGKGLTDSQVPQDRDLLSQLFWLGGFP